MKQFIHFSFVVFIAIILTACGTKTLKNAVDKGANKLNGSALQEIISGSTVKASGYGQEAKITFHGNFNLSATNTDKEKELAAAFGIRSIPSILFVPKNSEPQMAQGALPKHQFEQLIKDVLEVSK